MNIKGQKFYAKTTMTGIGEATTHEGTIRDIILSFTQLMINSSPRKNSNGVKTINLIISDSPQINSADISDMMKLEEVSQNILTASQPVVGPDRGELANDYYDRISCDHSKAEALVITKNYYPDWTPPVTDESLIKWLADEKAKRFRELNGRQAAFDSASPEEYQTLKAYCAEHFPSQLSLMRLKG